MEGRKPRRSRIVLQACLIRSARLVAEASGSMRGKTGVGCGGGEVMGGGGASPDDRIGSDEPVSREAAVAAAATLDKKE